MQYRTFGIIIILTIITFLAGGGLAFTRFLLNKSEYAQEYTTASSPKQLAVTPIAIFLIIMGALGIYMLILAGQNLQHKYGSLGKNQLIVGFTFIFSCYLGFLLLQGII